MTVTLNWAHDLLLGSLANEAVVSDGLDVEETSIGLKADLPKRREVLQSLPIRKSRVLLMVVSVRRAQFNLKYCLIRELL